MVGGAAGLALRRHKLVSALHDRAVDNPDRYRGPRRCGEVQLICGDATDTSLPDGVTHIFLNNPFEADLVDRFLDRVVASQQRRPRRIRVIYLNPTGAQRILARGARPVTRRGLKRLPKDLVVYDVLPRASWYPAHRGDGHLLAWRWTFSDGSTAAGRVVTHAFGAGAAPGAALTVTDGTGTTASTP